MNSTPTGEVGIVVAPIRFTERPEAMRVLLETLGLVPRIESEHGGWLDLSGRGGLVALHDAASSDIGAVDGETVLSFEVDDADLVAERLRAADLPEAVVYDESYGRVVALTDHSGASMLLNERSDDLYGYRRHPDDVPAASVVPVRFTDDAAGAHRLLTALGLAGEPHPGDWSAYAAAGGEHGWVGVHPLGGPGETSPVLGEAAHTPVALSLYADLDATQRRLAAAGVDHERVAPDGADQLRVPDPDGQVIEVHAWPAGDA